MSKKCRNCGAELPEGAAFCPSCTQSQIERAEVKPPRLWRKKAAIVLMAVLLLCIAALTIYLIQRPKVYEGGASVTYTDKDGTYELLVSFFPGDIIADRPISNKTVSISRDEMSMDTSPPKTLKITSIPLLFGLNFLTVSTAISAALSFGKPKTPVDMQQKAILFILFSKATARQEL